MGVEKTGIFSGNVYYNPKTPKTETTDTTQKAKEPVDVKAKPTTTELGRALLNDPWYSGLGVNFTTKVPAWNNPNLTTAQRLELAFAEADPLNNLPLGILDEEIPGIKPDNSQIADMKIAEYEARQNRTADYIAANWA